MKDYICIDCLHLHEAKVYKCSKCHSKKILDFQTWVVDKANEFLKETKNIKKELIKAIIEPLLFCLSKVGRLVNSDTFKYEIEAEMKKVDTLLNKIKED